MREKLTSTPGDIVAPDSISQSDNAVRQALLRLGAGERKAPPRSERGGAQAGRPTTRHRFVQDGEVSVQYAERPRNSVLPSAPAADAAVVEALREELNRERQLRLDAEAALREVQTSLQTRLAHLEFDLQEARARADTSQEEIAVTEARSPVRRAPPGAPPVPPRPARRGSRSRSRSSGGSRRPEAPGRSFSTVRHTLDRAGHRAGPERGFQSYRGTKVAQQEREACVATPVDRHRVEAGDPARGELKIFLA